MAASTAYRLSKAAKRRQDTLRDRPKAAGMPPVIKPSIWGRARTAYFQSPITHRQLLQKQMADAGVE